MSKEKMIETIKQIIEFTEDVCIYETENKTMKEVLNYIDKLQKENEELKRKLKSKEKQIKLMQEMNLPDEIEKNYVSKDKINEIVEKSYNDIDYFKRDIIKDLEELLGE